MAFFGLSLTGMAFSAYVDFVYRRMEAPMLTMHPGEFLKLIIVERRQISPAELARRLQVPVATIEDLLAENIDLSPELAVRLSYVVGPSAESWTHMQAYHNLRQALIAFDPTGLEPFGFTKPPRAAAA